MSFPVLCWATAGGVTSEDGKSEVEGILLHPIGAYIIICHHILHYHVQVPQPIGGQSFRSWQ